MTDLSHAVMAPGAGKRESLAAIERAKEQLARVLDQGPEITRVTESLRHARERNHYGERMAESMRRKGV